MPAKPVAGRPDLMHRGGGNRPTRCRARAGLDRHRSAALRSRDSGAGGQRKIPRTLARATPEQRAVIYGQTMGLRITYNPEEASIEVEARPACSNSLVGGAFTSPSTPALLRGKVLLGAA